MSELGKLYPDVLLDHHRAPRRAGRLATPTHAADGNNPLCGDRVAVTLEIGQGRLLDIRCEVKGCAICRAAGSMMAEAVAGCELAAVNSLLSRFLLAIGAQPGASTGAAAAIAQPLGGEATEDRGPENAAPDDGAEWGPLAALLEARRFPNRRRCASLSWEVLERALSSPNEG
jgi:nitrogen fixation protein NifU and related proteins